jgi:hypothetical protein
MGRARAIGDLQFEGSMPRVLVLGANGGMGRRITALWALQGASAMLRLAVRRKEAMENFGPGASVVIARLEEPATLRDALAGVAVVINAMGPYLDVQFSSVRLHVEFFLHRLQSVDPQPSRLSSRNAPYGCPDDGIKSFLSTRVFGDQAESGS